GLFAGPFLAVYYRFTLRRAVATGLILVFVNALTSTVTEVLRPDSRVLWTVVAATAAGSLIGAQGGFSISKRLDERRLRQFFVIVLAIAGARVFRDVLAGGRVADVAAGGEVLGLDLLLAGLAGLLAGLAGLGGGILAPILGIGGGLLIVPALYLLVPAIGFPEARACSMAVIVVSSSRSLYLHGRAGNVSWNLARFLAVGAAIGAVGGVVTVKQPGLALFGQIVLGATLWLVAGRFVVELARGRRASDGATNESGAPALERSASQESGQPQA
ncbi:MAG: TSUP family transporter, partial [Planctomycetota bacterium]